MPGGSRSTENVKDKQLLYDHRRDEKENRGAAGADLVRKGLVN